MLEGVARSVPFPPALYFLRSTCLVRKERNLRRKIRRIRQKVVILFLLAIQKQISYLKKNMETKSYGLHWFRRDLRIPGNAGLRYNWKMNDGRVLGIFCFDSKFLGRSDFSSNRFAFFLKRLSALKIELQDSGGDLLVLDILPQDFFRHQLLKLGSTPSLITWSRDYEPFARQRDAEVQSILRAQSIPFQDFRDHLVFEPHEVLKDSGDPYSVYSPFAKKYFSYLNSDAGQDRLLSSDLGLQKTSSDQDSSALGWDFKRRPMDLFRLQWSTFLKQNKVVELDPWGDCLGSFQSANQLRVSIEIPEAGEDNVLQQLKGAARVVDKYHEQRDFPGIAGTSRLSMYFKNGSITTSQVMSALGLRGLRFDQKSGRTQFLKELVWREFYYSILFHFPWVEDKAFVSKYQNLSWGNNESWFQSWVQGKTGYPLVDAGMRELLRTGWMHNRVRMVVASFLTKDLLIDWKWGEKHFMNLLLDGDLAPNNGGWQWAASTGCDPQPYFRIFNPYLQSEKFDPSGAYIRKFVPELSSLSDKEIHRPLDPKRLGYPEPIVDHFVQKEKALKLFSSP